MLLRTYPLIVHPAYLDHIEASFNADRLRPISSGGQGQVPRLDDAFDIALYLGIGNELIVSMLSDAKRHYRAFPVTKRSGGERIIRAPRTYLKVVQWWILDCVLNHVTPHDCAYGFVRGRSFIENARRHVDAKHICNVDIKDFFPSIKVSSIEPVFSQLGYDQKVSHQLASLTTYSGELPQGAPTSPSLANAIFKDIDKKISDACNSSDVIYTRYADDLTFSSQNKISQSLINYVEYILIGGGFYLNRQKTRYMGLNDKKEVTGIVIGRDSIRLSRDYLNGTRGWLYKLKSNPVSSWSQIDRVVGTRNLIAQVGGAGSKSLLELADQAIETLQAARAYWLATLID